MATIFQNYIENAKRKGFAETKSREAIDWFRLNVRKTSVSETRLMREEASNLVASWSQVGIGKLYFAHYQAKHAKSLPYWDRFPMMIPIHKYKDGFLGLNLHYLPPVLRAKILSELYDTITSTTLDERKKMAITYAKLGTMANHNLVSPCIKRYLGDHFRSKFLRVPYEDWTTAIFLPVERFEKSSRNDVWKESRRQIYNLKGITG